MKLTVLAVRDSKTDGYGNPIFTKSIGEAVRSFSDAINQEDKTSMLWTHPEDFDLYLLGEFDTETGLFNTGVPKQQALGRELKILRISSGQKELGI